MAIIAIIIFFKSLFLILIEIQNLVQLVPGQQLVTLDNEIFQCIKLLVIIIVIFNAFYLFTF